MARELASKGDRASALEFLKEARAGLAQSYAPYRVEGYMGLVSNYAELEPADAINVLNEAIKAINAEEISRRQRGEYPDTYERINALSNELLLQLFKLPVALFEIDDLGVREALSSIKTPMKRAAIRLNLLTALLQQHRAMAIPPSTTAAQDRKDDPE